MTSAFDGAAAPAADLDSALAALHREGVARLPPSAWETAWDIAASDLARWSRRWDALPPDRHLRDGGRYRRRRHGCWWADGRIGRADGLRAVAHRAHWQPVAYNALHGGIERWFDPIPDDWSADPAWQRLLQGLAAVATALRGGRPSGGAWAMEVHPFRIDTTDGIGRPTPEGAHRDGVDLVAVMLVARHGIKGGETRVFEADGPRGLRFTMTEPGTLLLLDDERVIHETTPIQPDPADGLGWRDTLVVTLRGAGFQGPDTSSAAVA